jgi:hypothetical protein
MDVEQCQQLHEVDVLLTEINSTKNRVLTALCRDPKEVVLLLYMVR